jgi:CheY-like chemotaxis protein
VVEGDAGQIRQVVLNLITNAADALDDGGVIRIASGTMVYDSSTLAEFVGGSKIDPGSYAWIEVSDNGSGMDRETRSRIFDPFFTTKKPGRGLGLATVLGIVKTHRGAVRVGSSPGDGTVVRVILPETRARVGDSKPAHTGKVKPLVEGSVLVVDDEERIRTLIAAILEREGMSTVLAADGQEAVKIFGSQGERIRLVLVDYTMPGLTGVDVFTRIREMDREVPIILMSGYGERTMVSSIESQGLTAFLQKPFDPRRLLEAVQRAFEPV